MNQDIIPELSALTRTAKAEWVRAFYDNSYIFSIGQEIFMFISIIFQHFVL